MTLKEIQSAITGIKSEKSNNAVLKNSSDRDMWDKTFDIALTALEQLYEREENRPLTIEELGDMVVSNTPVWTDKCKRWNVLHSVNIASGTVNFYGFANTLFFRDEVFRKYGPKHQEIKSEPFYYPCHPDKIEGGKVILKYIGKDSWGRPVFRDEYGYIWKDVELDLDDNISEWEGIPQSLLYESSDNTFDGEPGFHMAQIGKHKGMEIVLAYDERPVSKTERHKYMMLGRMKADCESHLYPHNNSWVQNIPKFISEMKEIWISVQIKPEWLTYEQIEEYETKMSQISKERAES